MHVLQRNKNTNFQNQFPQAFYFIFLFSVGLASDFSISCSFYRLTGATGFLVRPFLLSLDFLLNFPLCSLTQDALNHSWCLRLFLWILCANSLWCKVTPLLATWACEAGEGKMQNIGFVRIQRSFLMGTELFPSMKVKFVNSHIKPLHPSWQASKRSGTSTHGESIWMSGIYILRII